MLLLSPRIGRPRDFYRSVIRRGPPRERGYLLPREWLTQRIIAGAKAPFASALARRFVCELSHNSAHIEAPWQADRAAARALRSQPWLREAGDAGSPALRACGLLRFISEKDKLQENDIIL